MPTASGSPPRPAGLPAAAVFNDADQEWELGERRGALQVGAWIWWRPDGTLLSDAEFDADGALHGIARRYHPSGELALEAPYHHGALHGRQIMTRPLEGTSPENPALLELEGVYRMDSLNVDGEPQGIATFYDKAGLASPVPAGADGRSIDLGSHLGKLRPSTALVMVTPFFHTMTGRLPSSMVSMLHYICLAMVGSTHHRLQVVNDLGEKTITIAEESEISRALSLAVDLRAAQLSPPPR
jgi:hypothetical protein